MSPAINKSQMEQLVEFLNELQKYEKISYEDFSEFAAIMSHQLDLIKPETSGQPPEETRSGE